MFKFLRFIILTFLLTAYLANSQNRSDEKKPETILKIQPSKSPLETMQEGGNSDNGNQKLPTSKESFTPEQDSAFFAAMRLSLPIRTLINNNLHYSDDLWNLGRSISQGTPWQIAIENLRSIPPEFYRADPVEMIHRQYAIEQSMHVPYINNHLRYGTKITFESIGKLFGLIEDTSTEIKYNLDYSTDVEVVIYSISSVVVATLFNGNQTPGSYKLTWNGRDEFGKMMPPGDYIAEVRIGKERYIRKRIEIR
ncbi:MAG: hypothetical protein KGZ71_02125 [Desulfobulbaceae bacterium]|nr:hypothetical protein [Candidatus Kapabacteria bacterium]MBS3999260.1 hypothetical protein [Desulfobulbaceae bacterium]